MVEDSFAELETSFRKGGAEAALDQLARQFREQSNYHALFDARLMQARQRLGLPIILAAPLEELDEPVRGQVESAYLEACRETGWLLWNEGNFREAWMYLRPLGENGLLADAIARAEPNEDSAPVLIDMALHEGVAPAHGFKLVLDQYGTCNAVTTFDTEMRRHNRREQQIAAGHLVRRLYTEVKANLLVDIKRREAAAAEPIANSGATEVRDPPPDLEALSLVERLAGRDWLFAENSYHIDTSHLAATVRIARIVEDPTVLQLAWELTEYGRRLASTFQLLGDDPFEDMYPSHGLFFAAQIGRQVDEGLAFFREKAEGAEADVAGRPPRRRMSCYWCGSAGSPRRCKLMSVSCRRASPPAASLPRFWNWPGSRATTSDSRPFAASAATYWDSPRECCPGIRDNVRLDLQHAGHRA